MNRTVVEQRVRNRIMEYLEIISEYSSSPPPWDLNETLNQWEDRNPEGTHYPSPTYTERERVALMNVSKVWNLLCKATPQTISDENKIIETCEWKVFTQNSKVAFKILLERGRLSEETKSEQDGI